MPALPFRDVFAARARRVRGALATRRILDGAVIGSIASALCAMVLAAFGRAPWTALALVPLAVATSLVVAARKRWSDSEVALFLDARLDGHEAVTSALGARDDELGAHLAENALRVLERESTPRVFSRLHAVLPLALLVVALAPRVIPASFAPLPVPPPPVEKPVRVSLKELGRLEELRSLTARTAEERARREKIAEQARALAERAAKGVERRDAMDALSKLRDAVNAESAQRLTTAAGRQAAALALAKNRAMTDAANALGRADLVAFDKEMEKLARSLEKQSRREAMAALDAAREAAVSRGDGELGDAIDEQKRLLKDRTQRSDTLEELSRLLGGALPKDAANRLKHLDRETSASSEALAESLLKAVEGLTPEERERIAKTLAASAAGMQGEDAPSKQELERLVKALGSEEGREELRRALKALANDAPSEANRRERALAAASLAIAAAEARVARGGEGTSGNNGSSGNGDGSGGVGRGGDQGSHGAPMPPVVGSSFVARADGTPTGGIPLGEVPGLSAVTPSGTTRARMEALEAARPRELGAVERSNVPREYRDQVGRYFAP